MTDWKLREDAEPQGGSDGFWYDINNGYIKPELLLSDVSQIQRVNEAVDTLSSFEMHR